jgi:hypothetical protein
MKLQTLFSAFIMAVGINYYSATAQEVNLSTATADPNTFVFNDGRNTVQGVIYQLLEKKTKCCGNDAIYLEVKIDPSGQVIGAKALTGKNDCYKNSVVDIVKQIKWNNATIKAPKSIYFEVKPVLACAGKADDNQYVTVNVGGTAVVAENNNDAKAKEEALKRQLEAEARRKAELEANAKKNSTTAQVSSADTTKPGLAQELPKQKYKSAGDRKPNPEHIKSFVNTSGPSKSTPVYIEGDQKMAVYIKQSLRKQGVCGLAHVLGEITIDKDGAVKSYRIFQTNNDVVLNAIGPVLTSMKFNGDRFDRVSYVEFKTDIDCLGNNGSKVDLASEPDYLKTGELPVVGGR